MKKPLPQLTNEDFDEAQRINQIKSKHIESARRVLVGGEKPASVADEIGISRQALYNVLTKFHTPKPRQKPGPAPKEAVDERGLVQCVVCREHRVPQDFGSDPRRPNGFKSTCNPCLNAQATRKRHQDQLRRFGVEAFEQETEELRETVRLREAILEEHRQTLNRG